MAPQYLQLPPQPNLAHLKRQAKRIVRDHKAGKADACGTLRRLRRFEGRSDDDILSAPVALHDAQYALALSYGCKSWNALRARVESAREPGRQPGRRLTRGTLWDEIDAVNEAYFWKRPPGKPAREASARFIAGYQGGPGSYAEMFRPDAGFPKTSLPLFIFPIREGSPRRSRG